MTFLYFEHLCVYWWKPASPYFTHVDTNIPRFPRTPPPPPPNQKHVKLTFKFWSLRNLITLKNNKHKLKMGDKISKNYILRENNIVLRFVIFITHDKLNIMWSNSEELGDQISKNPYKITYFSFQTQGLAICKFLYLCIFPWKDSPRYARICY